MNIRPMNDNILVMRVEEEQKTVGGIIIPDNARKKSCKGKVISAGSGRVVKGGKKIPLEVKKGDTILFNKYAGTEIKINGVEHVFMKETDLMGIFE